MNFKTWLENESPLADRLDKLETTLRKKLDDFFRRAKAANDDQTMAAVTKMREALRGDHSSWFGDVDLSGV